MKFNYRLIIFSIIFTIFSLTGYLLFEFIELPYIQIGQDICISIFSSSIFVVITSIVGYSVERRRLLLQLFDCAKNLQIIYAILNVSLVENNRGHFDLESVKSILRSQQEEMNKLFVLLNDFYPTKDVKKILIYWNDYNNYLDKKLKEVCEGIRAIFKSNKETNDFNLSELIEENSKLVKQLKDWLKNEKFIFPNK